MRFQVQLDNAFTPAVVEAINYFEISGREVDMNGLIIQGRPIPERTRLEHITEDTIQTSATSSVFGFNNNHGYSFTVMSDSWEREGGGGGGVT